MVLRKSSLAGAWYPGSGEEIERFLAGALKKRPRGGALAAVAPHAGWYYSGALAAQAAASLALPGAEDYTVAVIGGHLPAGAPPLFAQEDGVSTPLGTLEMDRELRDALWEELGGAPDQYRDNTVEVQLPLVKGLFPKARLLWLRLPEEEGSYGAGKSLAAWGQRLSRRVLVLASTDLTHYGPNYGFSPQGGGREALDWVRQVNDAGFIAAVQAGDPALILDRAGQCRAACSAGAVLGALGFVHAQAASAAAELLGYATSADAEGPGAAIPPSFVGYAALAFRAA